MGARSRQPARLALVTALLVAASACTGKKAEAGRAGSVEPILVGQVSSLTGSEATIGVSTDNAIRLAVDHWNRKGGVKGRPVELRTYDTQGKPEEAAVAATRLLVTDKVSLLLGEEGSNRSLAVAPIADTYSVPMITPSSTSPRVTMDGGKVRPYVFRVCFIDPFQGSVMARFARDRKLGRVAILRDVGSDYSVGLASVFAERFKELGGEVVGDAAFKSGDQDFKAQLTSIRGGNPDALYIPAYYGDVALIARQARELGMKQLLLGGDGWDSTVLLDVGGKAVEGSFYTSHYSPQDPSPRIQEFVRTYRERYGATPDALAVLAYDAAMLGLDAMNRAPDLSGPAVREILAATRSFPGVSGDITIDARHDAVKPAVILQIRGGKPTFVTTITP